MVCNDGRPPKAKVEVNWKGLFYDSRFEWVALSGFLITVVVSSAYLINHDYFKNKKIDEQVEEFKILNKIDVNGTKLLISGNITKDVPMEIVLPKDCEVNQKLIGQNMKLTVATQYKEYNKSEYYELTDINKLCKKEIKVALR